MIEDPRRSADGARLLVVSELRLFREGLVALLASCGWGRPVMAVGSAHEALDQLEATRVDVLLLDMALPGGADAVRAIVARHPDTQVLAIGLPEVEPRVIAWAEAGIAGYVTREASADDLIRAVAAALDGDLVCSPRIARSLLRRVSVLSADRAPPPPTSLLTPRESEIARLLEQGCSNKEIAARLCIQVATVKNHVHHILDKLQVSGRGQAAARVRRAPRALAGSVPEI